MRAGYGPFDDLHGVPYLNAPRPGPTGPGPSAQARRAHPSHHARRAAGALALFALTALGLAMWWELGHWTLSIAMAAALALLGVRAAIGIEPKTADRALYAAKRQGRNAVVVAGARSSSNREGRPTAVRRTRAAQG